MSTLYSTQKVTSAMKNRAKDVRSAGWGVGSNFKFSGWSRSP